MKVAWEILKALQIRERGPVLIACPTCGRLQFDMDSVVAEIEARLEAYTEPIESRARLRGERDRRGVYAGGSPVPRTRPDLRGGQAAVEGPRGRAGRRAVCRDGPVLDRGTIEVDDGEAAEGAQWLAKIEEENAGELTPERIAQMEAEKAREEGNDVTAEPFLKPVKRPAVDEEASPTAGRATPRLSVLHPAASAGFERSAGAYDRARPDYPGPGVDALGIIGLPPAIMWSTSVPGPASSRSRWPRAERTWSLWSRWRRCETDRGRGPGGEGGRGRPRPAGRGRLGRRRRRGPGVSLVRQRRRARRVSPRSTTGWQTRPDLESQAAR